MHRRALALIHTHKVDLAGFVFSCVFGALFCWLITPPGFIAGVSSYWQTQLEDIAQYLSGYKAFMAAPWSLPLLSIPSLNWPQGTTLTFVDAIPLFSLGMKMLGTVLPIPDNPLGLWVALCFTLQGGAAWILGRHVAGRDYGLVLLAVALCVMMPSLSARMGHLSLQAHFILLLALTLYVRTIRLDRPSIGWWTLLILFSFYTNFYLTAMALAVMAASAGDRTLRMRRWMPLLAYAIPLVALLLSVPLMLGTAFGSAVPDTGFGHYSMNVLSPIGYGWFIRLPFFVAGTEGQYEGYNYLGLGLIVLLGFAFWHRRKKGPDGQLRFGPFFMTALVLCTIYALSNEVYLSDIHLVQWDVPGSLIPLFEAFRSSGRFFWVVTYAAIVFGLLRLSHLGVRTRTMMIVAVLAVQVGDLAPTYASIKQSLDREPNILADLGEWNAALEGVTTIHAFPKFKCPGGYAREVLPLQMVAAEGGYNLTTGFISRYGADCDAVEREIASSDPLTSVYVFAHTHYLDDQIQSFMPANAQCQKLEIWTLCRIPQ
ncbi:hypothetical protein SAMN05216456_0100 [Devosia crocina]|uniref:4-amino-4-deoxy-L-arabinose transferase n=1 Tax=Devosia crocina TaxID=429728 RepID=A0A1I7MWH7_9HYPH|nr:DUF6311 domain-containing protein [Devosia crocina]SFV26750.1 hypothetical protein SAMN05216456_0100 [Devosia crocina]